MLRTLVCLLPQISRIGEFKPQAIKGNADWGEAIVSAIYLHYVFESPPVTESIFGIQLNRKACTENSFDKNENLNKIMHAACG